MNKRARLYSIIPSGIRLLVSDYDTIGADIFTKVLPPQKKKINDTVTFNFPAHGQNIYEVGRYVTK